MADRVILVGGGGFCRELIIWASHCHAAGTLAPVGGYIDDTGATLARFSYDCPYLGSIEDYVPKPGDGFILAVGSPKGKRILQDKLRVRGGTFPRLIHPSAYIAPTAQIDEGVLFTVATLAGPDTRIDRFVTLNGGAGVGHDSTVGEFTTLSSHIDVMGNVQIGPDVMVGSKALFMPKVKVGAGATVGAGSVVYRSIKAGMTVYAPPAKLLKMK